MKNIIGKLKNIIITGATSGIGLAVCTELVKSGHRVVGIGRNPSSCEKAKGMILEEAADADICFYDCDFVQLSEVKALAGKLIKHIEEVWDGKCDVLINNAGGVRSRYCTSKEGYEEQFALNHLSSFLLTHLLIKYIAAAKGRIIFTSSESHKNMKMRWDDLMFTRFYHPLKAYKQSKLANMLFAFGINDRYEESGIKAYCIDPGLVKTQIGNKQTYGIVSLAWSLRKRKGVSPLIPARTYLYLCNTDEHPKGLYFHDSKEKQYSKYVTRENADHLWRISENLCGIIFGRVK